MKTTVIGLGYVGLPLAIRLSQIGFSTNAIDKDISKIASLKNGKLPFAQDEPYLEEFFKKARPKIKFLDTTKRYESTELIFVAIDTPLIGIKPNNHHITKAIKYLSKNLKKGSIVVIESTIAPKTAKNIIIPLIEKKAGLKVNKDFYVAVASERIRPKFIFKQLTTLPRVIGVSSKTIIPKLRNLYKKITSGEIDFTDLTTAETVKTVENSFRDVNVAFANEVALACEELGVNVWRVRELVNRIPFYDMHQPGAGVGGHCIPKDPWLLASSVKKRKLDLVTTARKINDNMPTHIFELTKKVLEEKKIEIKNANLAILGYSYVGNSDDTRNSPTEALVNILDKKKIKYKVYDPYVQKYSKLSVYDLAKKSDALLLVVAHDSFKKLDFRKLSKIVNAKIVIDGRNFFNKQMLENQGFTYKGVGNITR